MASTLTLWTTLARFAQALARSAHLQILATCVKVTETMLRVMEMVAVNACQDGSHMTLYLSNASAISHLSPKIMPVSIAINLFQVANNVLMN